MLDQQGAPVSSQPWVTAEHSPHIPFQKPNALLTLFTQLAAGSLPGTVLVAHCGAQPPAPRGIFPPVQLPSVLWSGSGDSGQGEVDGLERLRYPQ